MVSPKELWQQLEPKARDMGMSTTGYASAGCIGRFEEYTAEELNELTRDFSKGRCHQDCFFEA